MHCGVTFVSVEHRGNVFISINMRSGLVTKADVLQVEQDCSFVALQSRACDHHNKRRKLIDSFGPFLLDALNNKLLSSGRGDSLSRRLQTQ